MIALVKVQQGSENGEGKQYGHPGKIDLYVVSKQQLIADNSFPQSYHAVADDDALERDDPVVESDMAQGWD